MVWPFRSKPRPNKPDVREVDAILAEANALSDKMAASAHELSQLVKNTRLDGGRA